MAGFTEKALADLGDDLGDHEDVPTLGRALGFKNIKVNQYMATNRVDGVVGSKGTVSMLFDWKRKTLKKDQIKKMREALVEAGFIEQAEEYCKNDAAGDSQQEGASSGSENLPTTSDAMYVTEQQLNSLASMVHGSFYVGLASALDFEWATYDNIKNKHHLDINEAMLELLHRWKKRTGGLKSDLATALRTAECGGLVFKINLETTE